jgi:membrane protein DedA with SNARE-associated domain
VPALRFGILSLIGTAVYASVLACVGYGVGSAWHSVAHGLSVAGYALAAIVVGAIAAFIVIRLRQQRRERRDASAVIRQEQARESDHSC